ncbi:MAG: MinD/ParA family protein [Chloroflexi bacterium]|nr:MinD/ParA family protein [Chloroflexota bacterium]
MTAIDQAAALREMMRRPGRASRSGASRVIAVASGKGGVGKTSLSINLAICLVREGARVIILDADLGLANVDVALGIVPRWTLEHVIAGTCDLVDVLQAGPEGILILPGASGIEEMANLGAEQRRHLTESLSQLESRAEIVLIDTAAGIGAEVSSFVATAPEVIVVTTPEPTAITDAYALIKVATRQASTARLQLVVNQAHDLGEAREVARKIIAVAREFLDVELTLLGSIPSDPYVGRAIRQQNPLVVRYPSSPASLAIARLARELLGSRTQVDGTRSGIIQILNRVARRASVAGSGRETP